VAALNDPRVDEVSQNDCSMRIGATPEVFANNNGAVGAIQGLEIRSLKAFNQIEHTEHCRWPPIVYNVYILIINLHIFCCFYLYGQC
jgi:hypothetical protein